MTVFSLMILVNIAQINSIKAHSKRAFKNSETHERKITKMKIGSAAKLF